MTITLAGLKDEYALNEPLNFTLNYKGYGTFCGDPTARIIDAASGKVAYDIPTLDIIVTCLPEAKDVDNTWTLYDIMYPDMPVIIGKPGHYRLEVEGEGVFLEKDFIVNDNVITIIS